MACRAIMQGCKQSSVWGRKAQTALVGRSHARSVQTNAKKRDGSVEDLIKKKNAENKVMIYSKTYCPYCSRAKDLFLNQLKTNATVAELDNIAKNGLELCAVEGADIQATLKTITGSGTVPQIFINGEYVGGCTDVMALHSSGKLVSKLDAAGVKHA